MPSEKQIDNYIDSMEERNQIYIEEELEYADNCHKLEGQIGCPLDVRCKVVPNTYIYTFGTSMEAMNVICRRQVVTISNEGVCISYKTVSGKERDMTLPWSAYKKTWWLRKDRSE